MLYVHHRQLDAPQCVLWENREQGNGWVQVNEPVPGQRLITPMRERFKGRAFDEKGNYDRSWDRYFSEYMRNRRSWKSNRLTQYKG